MKLAVTILAGICLISISARAETFVLVPPHTEGENGAAVGRKIVRLVAEELRDHGHRAILPDSAEAEVVEGGACGNSRCANKFRIATGAAAAVVTVVRRGTTSEATTSVTIQVTPDPDIVYSEGVVVDALPLLVVARPAWRKVFDAYRRGPGPWLRVTGRPEGAAIYVNDAYVGTVPKLLRVPSGHLRVRVTAEKYSPKQEVVTLDHPSDLYEMEAFLLVDDRSSGATDSVAFGTQKKSFDVSVGHRSEMLRRPPRWADWLVGGGLVVAGGALTTLSSLVLATDGDCRGADQGRQCDRISPSKGTVVQLVLGLAATVGGAVWLSRMPVSRKWSISATRSTASLSFQERF